MAVSAATCHRTHPGRIEAGPRSSWVPPPACVRPQKQLPRPVGCTRAQSGRPRAQAPESPDKMEPSPCVGSRLGHRQPTGTDRPGEGEAGRPGPGVGSAWEGAGLGWGPAGMERSGGRRTRDEPPQPRWPRRPGPGGPLCREPGYSSAAAVSFRDRRPPCAGRPEASTNGSLQL